MRKFLALVFTAGLVVLLFLVVTANHALNTLSEPDVIISMLNDAEAYDYLYDEIIANLVYDVVEKGIEVNSGIGDSSKPTILEFDDPDTAAAAITLFVETLVPREYLRQKIEEGLREVVPYATGQTDEFKIDLEVQDRLRDLPDSLRTLVGELRLVQQLTDDLLIPQMSDFSSQISGSGLGIEFTQKENEDNAREIFAPEWVEKQLFQIVDELTPYFVGDSDGFSVLIKLEDRVVIIGEILKGKIASDDTLYKLVFAKVIDPAIQGTVDQSTSVGFGVSLTEQEVTDAVEVIAPPEWVRGHGDGVIDALVEYLLGDANDLHYSVDMADRKAAAAKELQALARIKLVSTLEATPACTSSVAAFAATKAVVSGKVPPCLSGGPMINMALEAFVPKMDQQVEAFVMGQIPGEISYSLSDFAGQGDGIDQQLEDVREKVIEGIRFTQDDLVEIIAGSDDPEALDGAEEKLTMLTEGVVITETNIIDSLGPDEIQQIDDLRGQARMWLSLKWLLWFVVLIPVGIIAFIGGKGWPGRLKWAGGAVVICGLIVYLGISLIWSVGKNQLPIDVPVSQEMKVDYPRLSDELESGSPAERIQTAMGSWQSKWRNQTLPWIILGLLSFTAGTIWSRTYREGAQVMSGEPIDDVVSESISGNDDQLPPEPEPESADRTGA